MKDAEGTTRSSTTASFAGSAPARSCTASCLAASTVKLPLTCPEPPRIGSRITGDDRTTSSSTMANGRPTFSAVYLAKARAPALLKRKVMTGSLVR